jgi:hypothetical protein
MQLKQILVGKQADMKNALVFPGLLLGETHPSIPGNG